MINICNNDCQECIYLNAAERDDPLLAITCQFEKDDFEYLRTGLWHFIKAVIADDYFRQSGDPVMVLELCKSLRKWIDLFYLLHQKNSSNAGTEKVNEVKDVLNKKEAMRQHQLSLKKIRKYYKGQIRWLSIPEINDLYLITADFFQYQSRHIWLEQLNRWQYYALSSESICEASDAKGMLEMYEHLQKLLEAAYLLNQRATLEFNFDHVTENACKKSKENKLKSQIC